MILGIEHIGLMARDPKKLSQWYQKVLNFKIIYKTKNYPFTFFLGGKEGSILEILPFKKGTIFPSEKEKESKHIALQVSNFEETISILERKGINYIDKTIYLFAGGKAIFFKDPEGNLLQLIYRPKSLDKIGD